MVEENVRVALARIHAKGSISFPKQVKEFWTKGFSLNRCYMPVWDEIRNVLENYNVSLSEHGTIMTMNELENIRAAKEIATKLASKENKYIDAAAQLLFLPVLRMMPIYLRKFHQKDFEKWIEANIDKVIEAQCGTVIDSHDKLKELLE